MHKKVFLTELHTYTLLCFFFFFVQCNIRDERKYVCMYGRPQYNNEIVELIKSLRKKTK